MKRKIGTFLLLIGVISLALFFISDIALATNFNYLLSGIIITGLGIYLMRGTSAAPAQESGRFRFVRRIFGRKKKKGGGDGEGDG